MHTQIGYSTKFTSHNRIELNFMCLNTFFLFFFSLTHCLKIAGIGVRGWEENSGFHCIFIYGILCSLQLFKNSTWFEDEPHISTNKSEVCNRFICLSNLYTFVARHLAVKILQPLVSLAAVGLFLCQLQLLFLNLLPSNPHIDFRDLIQL